MNKTVITLLFLFGVMIGGYFYLDSKYFFEITLCHNTQGYWSDTEKKCMSDEDIDICREDHGIWIDEENLCDYGEIVIKK